MYLFDFIINIGNIEIYSLHFSKFCVKFQLNKGLSNIDDEVYLL